MCQNLPLSVWRVFPRSTGRLLCSEVLKAPPAMVTGCLARSCMRVVLPCDILSRCVPLSMPDVTTALLRDLSHTLRCVCVWWGGGRLFHLAVEPMAEVTGSAVGVSLFGGQAEDAEEEWKSSGSGGNDPSTPAAVNSWGRARAHAIMAAVKKYLLI